MQDKQTSARMILSGRRYVPPALSCSANLPSGSNSEA